MIDRRQNKRKCPSPVADGDGRWRKEWTVPVQHLYYTTNFRRSQQEAKVWRKE